MKRRCGRVRDNIKPERRDEIEWKRKNNKKASEEKWKREEKRFHDPNPERWRRSHSRRVIISLHYFPPSLPSSSSSWRLSESLKTSHTRAQHRHNNCTPFLDRHSTNRDFSDLKAQWKLCDIFTDHLRKMKSSSEHHIHHQFYFLHDVDVVIIVKLSSTDISRFLAILFSTLPSDMHSKEVRIINEQVQRMVDCAVEFSVSAQLASLDLAPSDVRRGIRVWRKIKDLKIWEIIRWQPYTAWISDPN